MTAKTAEHSWTPTSRETGNGEAVLMPIAGLIDRIRLHALTRRQLRNLSPAQLHDIGLDPSRIHPDASQMVDPATMANLMSLR